MINSIKSRIESKLDLAADQQRLLFGIKDLRDGTQTLADYDIKKESTLHLFGRLQGGEVRVQRLVATIMGMNFIKQNCTGCRSFISCPLFPRKRADSQCTIPVRINDTLVLKRVSTIYVILGILPLQRKLTNCKLATIATDQFLAGFEHPQNRSLCYRSLEKGPK